MEISNNIIVEDFGLVEMDQETLGNYKNILQEFLEKYIYLINNASYGKEQLRYDLQKTTTLVVSIVQIVHGGITLTTTNLGKLSFQQAIRQSLSGIVGNDRSSIESMIIATLNEAIGNIELHTIPRQEVNPVIPIVDIELSKRCLDLLNTNKYLDRALREATTILGIL